MGLLTTDLVLLMADLVLLIGGVLLLMVNLGFVCVFFFFFCPYILGLYVFWVCLSSKILSKLFWVLFYFIYFLFFMRICIFFWIYGFDFLEVSILIVLEFFVLRLILSGLVNWGCLDLEKNMKNEVLGWRFLGLTFFWVWLFLDLGRTCRTSSCVLT